MGENQDRYGELLFGPGHWVGHEGYNQPPDKTFVFPLQQDQTAETDKESQRIRFELQRLISGNLTREAIVKSMVVWAKREYPGDVEKQARIISIAENAVGW